MPTPDKRGRAVQVFRVTNPVSFHRHVVQLLILLVLLVGTVYVYSTPSAFSSNDELSVTFFSVGQGDAIFIESPTGIQMLIDGGPPGGGVLRSLAGEMGFFDRSIDFILATHPDTDHVGGLPDVLERYQVDHILVTENKGDTNTARAFVTYAEQEGADITNVRRGMRYDLGGGAILTILFPDHDPSLLETNTSSIIARLTHGEREFLFTGDSPKAIEEYLVMSDGEKLHSDVLKVGHHGSRTSSGRSFVDMVQPLYAVISSGKDNKYGHPHKEVVSLFREIGAQIKNTAESGSITFLSNGHSLWVED